VPDVLIGVLKHRCGCVVGIVAPVEELDREGQRVHGVAAPGGEHVDVARSTQGAVGVRRRRHSAAEVAWCRRRAELDAGQWRIRGWAVVRNRQQPDPGGAGRRLRWALHGRRRASGHMRAAAAAPVQEDDPDRAENEQDDHSDRCGDQPRRPLRWHPKVRRRAANRRPGARRRRRGGPWRCRDPGGRLRHLDRDDRDEVHLALDRLRSLSRRRYRYRWNRGRLAGPLRFGDRGRPGRPFVGLHGRPRGRPSRTGFAEWRLRRTRRRLVGGRRGRGGLRRMGGHRRRRRRLADERRRQRFGRNGKGRVGGGARRGGFEGAGRRGGVRR
jgi:hypothetical protein